MCVCMFYIDIADTAYLVMSLSSSFVCVCVFYIDIADAAYLVMSVSSSFVCVCVFTKPSHHNKG